MDREQIISRNPIISFLEGRGVTMRTTGGKLTSNRCALNEHKPGHQCVNVDAEKDVWYCNDCKAGGSVIDWLMSAEGITSAEAMKRLGGDDMPPQRSKPLQAQPVRTGEASGKVSKTYSYTDDAGKVLFQVLRYEPKDFRQRAPDGNGGWVYKLDGVRRVPYNLPKILTADFVVICEGEKDADALNEIGFVATTNCGGAEKWDATYTPFFRGKDVALMPDNDKAGAKHRDLLRAQLGQVVRSMRIIEMPDGIKDVSDFVATFPTPRDAGKELLNMADRAEVLYRGEAVPIQTMDELEQDYREHIKRAATHQLSLGDWLPALRGIRPLVPGELCTILAGTGCGKTMFLQNLALNTGLHTLLFETELPGTLSFERFASMTTASSGRHVEDVYRGGNSVDWRKGNRLDHIVCCHKSKLSTDDIAKIIRTAELKTAQRPVLVLIDYIQLVQGSGESRYERTSCVAEQLKVVAKETNTIIVMASQVGRKNGDKNKKGPDESREVRLEDGKDSGSIENSSGLVIGGWRDANEKDRLWLRVLKSTKGGAGITLACRISDSLLIKQETGAPTP